MKKSAIFIVLLVIVSMGIFGCSREDSSGLKVGVIAELTGDIPAVGASCKNAAEMAVAEVNDSGGIQLGDRKYKIDLIIEDNAGVVSTSRTIHQQLNELPVHAAELGRWQAEAEAIVAEDAGEDWDAEHMGCEARALAAEFGWTH